MSRKLVAYFSASGVTAKVAETLSDALGADLFEIVPKVRYTKADLDWRDKTSRSTIEMNNPASRPEIETLRDNVADYDMIYVGFPIWWYVAPTIINSGLYFRCHVHAWVSFVHSGPLPPGRYSPCHDLP